MLMPELVWGLGRSVVKRWRLMFSVPGGRLNIRPHSWNYRNTDNVTL